MLLTVLPSRLRRSTWFISAPREPEIGRISTETFLLTVLLQATDLPEISRRQECVPIALHMSALHQAASVVSSPHAHGQGIETSRSQGRQVKRTGADAAHRQHGGEAELESRTVITPSLVLSPSWLLSFASLLLCFFPSNPLRVASDGGRPWLHVRPAIREIPRMIWLPVAISVRHFKTWR